MNVILPVAMLTQSETFLIGPITDVFAFIMNFIFDLVYSLTPANSLAISIIVFTLLVKFLMMPMMIKQQKSMRKMQLIQPKIQKLQKKYENKKDPESQQKMQMEMQQLYKKNNASPFSGCLPLFIQFPIFLALYQLFRYAPAYIDQLNVIYTSVADIIMSADGGAQVIQQMQETYNIYVQDFDPAMATKIIDVVYQFTPDQWTEFYASFPALESQIGTALVNAKQITMFLGIFDLSVIPGWGFPGIIIPIIAGGATFLQSRLMMARSKAKNAKQPENDTAQQTQKIMNMVFPVMMIFISGTTPAGLSVYWITSNVFQIVQQAIINRIMDKEEEVRLEEERKLKAKRVAARKRKLAEDTSKSSSTKKKKNPQGSNSKKKPSSNQNKKPIDKTQSSKETTKRKDKKPSNQE